MIRRLAMVLLLVGTCMAQDSARMEQVVQSYVAAKQFMGSVLVAKGDQIILSKGYGFGNLEWQVPNSPESKFRLGSITKQFTAACILMLEERGKLKVDDPIKKYMADAPAAWDKISFYHLLTHTSGIPSFTSFPDYASTEPFPATPEKLVARFRDKPLEFQPGEKWNYSNSGYILLGYLIEKITGEPYSRFVQQNIFDPLGMKDSGYDSNTAIILHRDSGYTPNANGELQNTGYIDMTIPLSAGGLYSTTLDLLKWEQGLFGGKLISAASLQKMTTPFKSDYAFGLAVQDAKGHKLIDHGGGIEGFNTELAYYPDEKLTVVVLSNQNTGATGDIGMKLAAVTRGEPVVLTSERKEIRVAPSILEKYVGTYELAPSFSIVMTVENGQLMTQATGQPKFPLFAESENKFFLKVVDAEVEFLQNDKGQVDSLILHQGGRDVKGIKK